MITDFNAGMLDKLRALYVEVTGNPGAAEDLTPSALEDEVIAKSAKVDVKETYRRLSAERAGLAKPPADGSKAPPIERLMRLLTSSGDSYEEALATVVGKDRAHAARAANDGWGSRSKSSHGCPDAR